MEPRTQRKKSITSSGLEWGTTADPERETEGHRLLKQLAKRYVNKRRGMTKEDKQRILVLLGLDEVAGWKEAQCPWHVKRAGK